MTDTTIISELLRMANIAKPVPPEYVRQLLYSSIVEIRDLRLGVGIPGSGTASDSIIGLADVAASPEAHSSEQHRAALLEAADMIRTLRVVAASGILLSLREAETDSIV